MSTYGATAKARPRAEASVGAAAAVTATAATSAATALARRAAARVWRKLIGVKTKEWWPAARWFLASSL